MTSPKSAPRAFADDFQPDDPTSQRAENLPEITQKDRPIKTETGEDDEFFKILNSKPMLDINQILATIFDRLKFSPKAYSALAILGSLLALVSMNPDWLPFTLSETALKIVGTLAVALLALTGSRTTAYLKTPSVSDEMKADAASLQKGRLGVNMSAN